MQVVPSGESYADLSEIEPYASAYLNSLDIVEQERMRVQQRSEGASTMTAIMLGAFSMTYDMISFRYPAAVLYSRIQRGRFITAYNWYNPEREKDEYLSGEHALEVARGIVELSFANPDDFAQ